MTKIGYIARFPSYDDADRDKEWMVCHGCSDIVEEIPQPSNLRPQWDKTMGQLICGDTLIISKLSHVVTKSSGLSFFLDYCRIKGIRLISIHDKIDSADELFKETRMSDVLETIAMLPKEIHSLRAAFNAEGRACRKIKKTTASAYNRTERYALVINMYKSGHSVYEIQKASGFSSLSSVFRILKDAGINQSRKTRNKG